MSADDSNCDEKISCKLRDVSDGEQACDQWSDRLRQLWDEARSDRGSSFSAQEVFDRLDRKYQPMVEAVEHDQGSVTADRIRARLAKNEELPVTGLSDGRQSS